MFDPIVHNGLVVGVVGSLLAACLLGACHRLMATRFRRRHREVILVDQAGKPQLGCRLRDPKFNVFTDTADRSGRIPIPRNWPDRMVVDVWKNGQKILSGVVLDFTIGNSIKLIIPPAP